MTPCVELDVRPLSLRQYEIFEWALETAELFADHIEDSEGAPPYSITRRRTIGGCISVLWNGSGRIHTVYVSGDLNTFWDEMEYNVRDRFSELSTLERVAYLQPGQAVDDRPSPQTLKACERVWDFLSVYKTTVSI